jgi:hypothetical protein
MATACGASYTTFLLKIATHGIKPDGVQNRQRLWHRSRVAEIKAILEVHV